MKKKLVSIFMLLLLLVSTAAAAPNNQEGQPQAGTAAAQTDQSKKLALDRYPDFALLHDEAGLLTAEQQKELSKRLEEISQDYDIRVAVLTLKKLPDNVDIAKFAEDYLFAHYRDLENSNGSIIFVQVTEDRAYRVTTDTNMMEIITNEEGYPYLKDEFIDSLKADEYFEAYMNFADGVDYLCSYYMEEDGVAYDPLDAFSIGGLILGLIMSIGIGAFVYNYLVEQMSNVDGEENADRYLDAKSFKLNQEQDVFLYTSTEVIHHESSSDNDSGSSSSSSSGGGGGSY